MARALVERAGFTGFGSDGSMTIPVYITYIDTALLVVVTTEHTLVTHMDKTALVMNRELTDLAIANKPSSVALVVQDVVLLLHISKGS